MAGKNYLYFMDNHFAYLRVMAVEYIDWFPGFIKCELVDIHGYLHSFVEKIPVMCGADSQHGKEGLYPIEITFKVKVLVQKEDIYTISTLEPNEIKTEEGITEFEVKKEQLIF